MRDEPRFTEHDTTMNLWLNGEPKWPNEPKAIIDARNALVQHLRSRGFKVGLCERTKKNYRSIAHNHHRGSRGDLKVRITLCCRHLEILFYQDLVHENRLGGEYDFRCRKKMPYLIGKQYELERSKIAALFTCLGLPDLQIEQHLTGMDYIQRRRDKLEAFQGAGFYERQSEYNRKCASGTLLTDGDCVMFRDEWSGRQWVGVAYANINNMWWVLLPGGVVRNEASFRLQPAAGDAQRGRWFPPSRIEKRLRAELDKAIKTESFERAAVLRDVIKSKFQKQPSAPVIHTETA